MVEEVSIAGLRAEQAARRAGVMAWAQSVVIFLLLVVVAEDYDHNLSMQSWASMHFAGLGFMLNGTLAAFYAGLLIGLFLKTPPPNVFSRRMKRKEPVVPNSIMRFYEEIAVLTSEPRKLVN
jgi:hypothetical protein